MHMPHIHITYGIMYTWACLKLIVYMYVYLSMITAIKQIHAKYSTNRVHENIFVRKLGSVIIRDQINAERSIGKKKWWKHTTKLETLGHSCFYKRSPQLAHWIENCHNSRRPFIIHEYWLNHNSHAIHQCRCGKEEETHSKYVGMAIQKCYIGIPHLVFKHLLG